ncbi:kinase-like domain-containing protein, partial [Cyathus striatus]
SSIYVAKRFFRLDDSEDADSNITNPKFDAHSHNVQIQAECSRLSIGKWFLNAYYELCRAKAVDVDEAIIFSDGYLAQELGENWSPASGMSTYETEGIMWLIEKRRPTTVIRFSGTLQHPSSKKDLRSSTIYAFAHFAYGYSNFTVVFADLQGTPSRVKGSDGLIIFDPMTHTVDGKSGIGDFGEHRITSFIHDHVCNNICIRLGL